MSKELEKFIKANADTFNQVEQPDVEQFWSEFQEGRKPRRSIKRWYGLSIAASILLLLSLFFFHQPEPVEQDIAFIENLEEIDPQLAEYQAMLVSTLALQDSTIQALDIDSTKYEDIYLQLQELDELTQKYREDLKRYGPEKKIIKSLLKCSKQRIRLYELLLYEVELNSYHEKLETAIQI